MARLCNCYFKGKDGGIEEDTRRLVEKIKLLTDTRSQAVQLEEIAMNLARYVDYLLES